MGHSAGPGSPSEGSKTDAKTPPGSIKAYFQSTFSRSPRTSSSSSGSDLQLRDDLKIEISKNSVEDAAHQRGSFMPVVDVHELCTPKRGESHKDFHTLAARIKSFDKDGDGKLNKREIREIFQADLKKARRLTKYRYFVLTMALFTVLIIAANVGLGFATASLAKDVSTQSNGILTVKGDNTVAVSTADVLHSLMLNETYLLPDDTIRDITSITVADDAGTQTVYRVSETQYSFGQWVDFQTISGALVTVDVTGVRVYDASGELTMVVDPQVPLAPADINGTQIVGTGNRRKLITGTTTTKTSTTTVKTGTGTAAGTKTTTKAAVTPAPPPTPTVVTALTPACKGVVCTFFCIRTQRCGLVLDMKGKCSAQCVPK
jgi:hypothetical protein